jgi:hypothetical protein
MKQFVRNSAVGLVALTVGLGLPGVSKANPNVPLGSSVSVTDVTDWSTTPQEVVQGTFPIVPAEGSAYTGGVYAGINTLSLSVNGGASFLANGFCIDPFHYSDAGPDADTAVPLTSAPKGPYGTMSSSAATQIEQLWYELYSSTMSDQSAAILQVAIWDVVSGNLVLGGKPTSDPVVFSTTDPTTVLVQQDALADIAGLTPNDPTANLIAVSGGGQDYVIDGPASVPDSGATLLMLGGSLVGLALLAPKMRRSAKSVV